MSKVHMNVIFAITTHLLARKPWSNCRDVLRPENSASLTSPDSSLCDVIAEEAIPPWNNTLIGDSDNVDMPIITRK